MSPFVDWLVYNNWELMHTEPLEPALHMALDKLITHEVGLGLRPPTLRFWEWTRSAVVLGRFQSLKNEVDIHNSKIHNVKIARRVSGGGAMFIEPESSITYSLSMPAHFVKDATFGESYEILERWLLKALRTLGIKCWFKPINDIESGFGKIGGSAQARFSGAILHHGTLSYDINIEKMLKILRIGREKLSDKGIKSAGKRVSSLKVQLQNITRTDILECLIETFSQECSPLNSVMIGKKTLESAQELVNLEFDTENWLKILP